jgi:hypothetical protein
MITLVAILHFAFILFVAFGGLLVLKWRKLAWIHLPCAIYGALIEIFQWNCPLTNVENALRNQPYGEGFIAHYLFRAIYPSGLTRGAEIAIAVFVTAVNTLVYSRVFPISRFRRA